ncbi:MAG: glycosyltransferase family 39 protein [Bacteroidota bacterium]|nr:glycosyltransferase family 39 protein [Bacteroidota bacterium]
MLKNFKITRNPYLLFFPFLVILIIYVLSKPSTGEGDEARYLMFAHNLTHGFYSPPIPDINLTNGPGYPIILMPFVAMGAPLIVMTLLNAFFYYFSIIFLYKALQEIVSYKVTLIFSFFWACYYIAYQNITGVMTEPFTYLLISILVFSLIKAFKSENFNGGKRYIVLAGFILGYIVLTKIAFMYVLIAMILGSSLFWLFHREVTNYKKGSIVSLIGLATVLPYMIYAYHLTGRMFYWNTNTGASMYWSSNPFPDEYGDWKQDLKQGTVDFGNYNIPGSGDSLIAHHQRDYEVVFHSKDFTQSGMAPDDAFKKITMDNIKNHPLKYLQNCVYNAGRLMFHYPFSYAVQRPKVLLVFPVQGIIFTLILFCLIPTLINWRKLIYPLKFMLFLTLLYLGLSTMVTAYVRMFTIIVPILLFWFAYIFDNTVKIKLHFNQKNEAIA